LFLLFPSSFFTLLSQTLLLLFILQLLIMKYVLLGFKDLIFLVPAIPAEGAVTRKVATSRAVVHGHPSVAKL